MADTPRVSVLMTVYNAAPWLREAVDSVLSQSYADWELVAIENGSTDASAAILASYADPRVRVTTVRENMGRTPALRHAFELARGEYIAVLDADDVAEPSRLERQVAFLNAHPDVSVVGSWTRRIDGEGRDIGQWTFPVDPSQLQDYLGSANPIVHSSSMYRADLAREVGGYPMEYPFAQDFGLWLRLAQRAPVAMIGEYLSNHRTLPGSMTLSRESRLMVARDTLKLLEYAATHLTLSPSGRRRNRNEFTIASLRYAVALVRAKHVARGLAAALRAIARNPQAVLWNRVYQAALFG